MTDPKTPLAPSAPAALWAHSDYIDITLGGAAKLQSSAVAPLVARARAMISVDRDNVATISKTYQLPHLNTAQGRRFKEAISSGQVLLMPWYSLTGLVTAATASQNPKPTSTQYRPDNPAVFDGREVKYEFIVGDKTPVEAHPSTPVSWLSGAMPVLVAEGQLKADSALTAMLLAAGNSTDDLKVLDGETTEDAMLRLRGMLEKLPEPHLILGIAGVHNWRHNAGEWQWVTMSGRTFLIGMDGDVATNPAVHSSTAMLWKTLERAKAVPKLLAIDAEAAGDDKLGIDDYLAAHGTWADLLAQAADEMPPYPADLSADLVGKYRINDTMTALEICTPVKDPDGNVVRGQWEPAGIDIGGRIISFTSSRVPTRTEATTGQLEPAASMADATVDIEVSWIDPIHGGIDKGVITGPADILNHNPDKWADKGATIPCNLLAHPDWPPAGIEARSWVRAVKEHRANDRVDITSWTRMGWVPQVGERLPAFIVGDQVVGDDDSVAMVNSGVSDDTLSECSNFGVDDIDPRPFTDPKYLEKLGYAWSWLIENYLLSDAWKNRQVGSLAVAAGLRPCLPLQTNSTLYFSGPPAGGKSWSAAAIAAFWARHKGSWSNKHLPGTAKDSAAYMAANLSQAVLWVADDLAPGTNRAKAEAERAAVEDAIRMVHNGKTAGRAKADGGVRRAKDPCALLVVTAENPPETPSVRQRTILVNFAKGSLSNSTQVTQNLVDGYTLANIPAFITQGFIKYLRHYAAELPDGWKRLVDEITTSKGSMKTIAEDFLKAQTDRSRAPGTETRAAEIASDLMIVFPLVADMLGDYLAPYLKPGYLDLFTSLTPAGEDQRDKGSVAIDIALLVADGWEKTLDITPGKNLLRAIASCLSSGKAHIISGDDPKREPGRTPHESTMLGWQMASDPARPMGDTIGQLLYDRAGIPFVLLDSQTAFRVAYATYPKQIGEGQSPTSSWQAFYDDELAHPGIERDKGRNGKLMNRSRVTIGKGDVVVRPYGVPVSLDVLLSAGTL